MADDSEKTEQATERQIQRFREEGRVATSRELTAAMSLTVGAMCLLAALPYTGEALVDLVRDTLSRAGERDFVIAEIPRLTWAVIVAMAPAVLAALLPTAVAALATGLAETSLNFTTDALTPKPERLNPFSAFQNIFLSRTPWVQLVKSLAISAAIAWATWSGLRDHLDSLPLSATWTVGSQGTFMLKVAWDVLERALPIAIAIGAADYAYQRWSMSEQMKMSKQDVKQEMKDQDGDPLFKARRRQMARQIAFSRQIADVQKADVVLTNPTHYAIALRYRKDEAAAPVVLARGVDALALQIRAEASRHDVPTVENRPLARALYAKARVGRPIPKDFFGPVAQVLAVVYKRRAARTPQR